MKVSSAETPDVPASLLTAVAGAIERLSTVRLFTRRPNSTTFDVTVCVLTLSTDDDGCVRYGHPPKETASEVVAEVMKRARTWTTENGDTKFQAQLVKAPGERGPEPKPQLVAFDTAGTVAPDANPEADLYVRIAEGLWKQHLALLTHTTALATAQVGMIQTLAGAFENIITRERAAATSQSETEIARLAAGIERDRMAMLSKSLVPMLSALQRKMGLGPASETAAKPDTREPLARQARDFVTSLSGPQWDVVRAKLSSTGVDALDRMRTVSADADVMLAGADFMSEPVEHILEVYAALSGEQQGQLEALQNAIADASEKAKAEANKPTLASV